MSATESTPAADHSTLPVQPGEPTWGVALLFPKQGDWTEEEYLALDTNRLVELSDGFLEVLPMPTVQHQLIVAYLYELIAGFVRAHGAGRVLFAPLPVHLWSGKYREPDIVYLGPERLRGAPRYPRGADLVVEVVSDDEQSRERDLSTKRDEYARAGIPEYWIVDPQERKITVLTLDEGSYRVHGEFAPPQTADSLLLPGFAVPVAEVLAASAAA